MNPAQKPKPKRKRMRNPPNPPSNDDISLQERLMKLESQMNQLTANSSQTSSAADSVSLASATSSKKSDAKSNKPSKQEKRGPSKEEKPSVQDITDQMRNAKISKNSNTKHDKQSAGPPGLPKEELLQQLHLLQNGKITTESVRKQKTSQSELNTKAPEIKTGPGRKQRLAEVNEINKNIEYLIKKIKPRCDKIIDNSLCLENSVVYKEWKNIWMNSGTVPIEKTKINDEEEIYRYSKNVLYQMIGLAETPDYYDSLRKLDILRGRINLEVFVRKSLPLGNAFLKRLLEATSEEERLELILDVAHRRKLIKRLDGSNFEFIPEPEIPEIAEISPRKPQRASDRVDDEVARQIEKIIKTFDNDDVINEKIFKVEFIELFKEHLDEEMKEKSIEEITNFLLEKNFASIAQGEIRVNARNNQEAYVSHPRGLRDPCINRWSLRNESMHGDIVKVLFKESPVEEILETESSADDTLDLDSTIQNGIPSDSGIFGCVLEIIQRRHSRRVIGNFLSIKSNKKKITFVPRDSKIPKIQVRRTSENVEFNEDELVVVEINGWKNGVPKGKFIQKLGMKGELPTENSAILLQHNLDSTPFSQEILDSLPKDDFQIPAEEFEYRQDLRKMCIFSIDPETARDLDDAVSCVTLPNGNYEIGVHISDVSYFLKEGSALDEIVKDKATTIYLVDQVYHMLPLPLCLLCSLLPGADKVAYSVFWEMDPTTAEIKNTRFTRSVLNSCAKLSYEHAQIVIEKTDENWSELEAEFPEIHNGFTASDVADVISKLHKIAVILREGRKQNGALKIDQPKISFKFTSNDQRMEAPVDFFQYCTKDSNRLIEEFMLLANTSVAKMIKEKFPEVSLLRRHDPPNATGLKKLVKNLEKHGIKLDTSSSSAISDSMEKLIAAATHRDGMNACLNLVVSKTMSRAKYFCSDIANNEQDFWHYALSIPIYTHFTSPIRRYADILVHRVLNAALKYEPETKRSPEEVQILAEICNVQKYNAKLAGDDSCNLYFMHFIETLKSRDMKVGVVGIFDYNLEVILIETGHVVKIMYQDLRKQNMIVNPVTESNPPRLVLGYKDKKINIFFGTELMTRVEVVKSKLFIKTIFFL